MATRTPKTITKSARIPPVATAEDIKQDAREKTNATNNARLAGLEAERTRAGFVGRLTGWGEGARSNTVFVLICFVVTILAVALFTGSDVEIKRKIIDAFQILLGGLAGYLIAGKTKS